MAIRRSPGESIVFENPAFGCGKIFVPHMAVAETLVVRGRRRIDAFCERINTAVVAPGVTKDNKSLKGQAGGTRIVGRVGSSSSTDKCDYKESLERIHCF